jgi:hypothetical protein
VDVKIPDKLIVAMARYYYTRSLHSPRVDSGSSSNNEGSRYTILFPKTVWDKQKEVANISAVCKKLGWGWEACAGTFWFHKPRKGKKPLVIEIDETKLFL